MGKGSLSVIAGGIDGDTLQPGLGQTEPARGQSGEISGAEIGKSYRAGDVGSDVCTVQVLDCHGTGKVTQAQAAGNRTDKPNSAD